MPAALIGYGVSTIKDNGFYSSYDAREDIQRNFPNFDTWLDDAGRALANAVLNTRAVMELDLAVIDGIMPRPLVQRLLERVEHHITAMPCFGADRPAVVMGRMGGAAAATGAAQLLLFHCFFSRAWNIFAT